MIFLSMFTGEGDENEENVILTLQIVDVATIMMVIRSTISSG